MVFRVGKSGNATGPFEWRGQKGCFEKEKSAFRSIRSHNHSCILHRGAEPGPVPSSPEPCRRRTKQFKSQPPLPPPPSHTQTEKTKPEKKEKNTTQNRPGLLAFSIPILVNWTSVILFQIEVNFCLPWSWLWCSAHSKTRHEWQGRTAWGSLSSGGGQKRKPAPWGKYPVRFFFLFLKLCNTVGKLK